MRALVFRGPWDLAVEERPDPTPGAGEVVLTMLATGICGSDIHGFTGETGRRQPGQVMGHETVGRVEVLGEGVDTVAVGDLVTVYPVISCGTCPACATGEQQRCPTKSVIGVAPSISSAFADRMLVAANQLVVMPDAMPVEYGALVEPLAVGYHAAVRGACGPDDRLLIIGGGPIGQACALAARRLGVTQLLVSEPDERRRRLLGDIGCSAVDPRKRPIAEATTKALGGGATVVLDAVGSTRSIADGLAATELGGRIVLVGMHERELTVPAYSVSTEERTIIGSFCHTAEEFAATAQWVGTAPAELGRLIEGRVGWDGAIDAFTSLAKGENPASKVLVLPAS